MEKKKNVKEVKTESKKQEKLTYEQLERVASDLNNRCNMLYQNVKELQAIIDDFNEIGMLLSILSKAEYFESSFVDRVSNKIQTAINSALDASEKKEETKEDNN